MPRRPVSIIVPVAAIAVLTLGACGSSGKAARDAKQPRTAPTVSTTPPSTLPEPELRAALATFFATKGGQDLMSFLRITAPLNRLPLQTRDQCRPYIHELSLIGTPDYFIATATKVPDPHLSRTFQDAVAAQRLYLAGCDTGQPLPANVPARIRPYLEKLRTEMAAHGIAIAT